MKALVSPVPRGTLYFNWAKLSTSLWHASYERLFSYIIPSINKYESINVLFSKNSIRLAFIVVFNFQLILHILNELYYKKSEIFLGTHNLMFYTGTVKFVGQLEISLVTQLTKFGGNWLRNCKENNKFISEHDPSIDHFYGKTLTRFWGLADDSYNHRHQLRKIRGRANIGGNGMGSSNGGGVP